ncbi:MAG: carboxymuconolactone decarboxylase family protein [Candidatus Odinarchaeota archaeon]
MRKGSVQRIAHLHSDQRGKDHVPATTGLKNAKTLFRKRSYTFQSFLKDFSYILLNVRSIRDTIRSKRISRRFAERIMLACTAVNDCIYCAWGHAKWALESGCTEEEISDILSLDFERLPREELVALAFAQHYAESRGNPSKEAQKTLATYYGLETSKDILNYIRMITLGNLLGNTLSAFESRLKGIPPEKGSLLFEFLVFSLGGFLLARKYAAEVNT